MKRLLPLLCTALLASCGGDNSQPEQSQLKQASARKSSAAVSNNATEYYPMVQGIYVAYFGRPADPAGLDFFASGFMSAKADTDLNATANMYSTNDGVKARVEVFSGSAESQALYPGDNNAFLDAIYTNIFNRPADPAGKAFWANALNSNAMTRANAAIIIMSSAQGTDATLISRKVQAAAMFTAAADTSAERAAYSGLSANAVVRTMMSGITLTTDMATVQATVDATLANLVASATPSFAEVRTIINQRCVGCHSAAPTFPGFNPAPLGIRYDSEAQIRNDRLRVYQSTVVNQNMPYGNMTGMTEAERNVIKAWFEAGAN